MAHHRRDLDEHSERDLLLLILAELADIEDTLAQLTASSHSPGMPVRGALIFEGEAMTDVTVPDTTPTQNASVSYVDADGAEAQPQSPPVWSSSDDAVASVDSSADPSGLTAVVTIHGVGSATISAAATNSDGSVATASGTITVAAAEPVDGTITFS